MAQNDKLNRLVWFAVVVFLVIALAFVGNDMMNRNHMYALFRLMGAYSVITGVRIFLHFRR